MDLISFYDVALRQISVSSVQVRIIVAVKNGISADCARIAGLRYGKDLPAPEFDELIKTHIDPVVIRFRI